MIKDAAKKPEAMCTRKIPILIRADANESIGTGHVMRCLSIADASRESGREVLFVTADHRGDGLMKGRGFRTLCLDSDWTRMDEENICSVVTALRPELLLVDSYYVSAAYFRQLDGFVRTAYIDDRNSVSWDVDTVINYNIFASAQSYPGCSAGRLLLGPAYAPLRAEFRNLPEHHHRDSVQDVLVTVGGADPREVTEDLMTGLCPMWPEVRFHFVVGALNPRLMSIQALAGQAGNIVLRINEQHMADLMQTCDLAVSAAGTTLYELCACGIPTVTFSLADNQLLAAEEFGRQGMMLSAGDCRGDADFVPRLAHLLGGLIADPLRRTQMSAAMQKLVDGRGAERLTAALL